MLDAAIVELLERESGLNVNDMATRLHTAVPMVRQAVATLVFVQKRITCDRRGLYRVGHPAGLLEAE